jgi:hypothetical protein
MSIMPPHGAGSGTWTADAYFAALARHNSGKLAGFDTGLVALHPDVGVALDARADEV